MGYRWILVGLAAVFSLAQLVITPPFQHPDEPAHYARILQLSRGDWIAEKTPAGTGAHFPAGWVKTLGLLSHVPFQGHVRVSREELKLAGEASPRFYETSSSPEFFSFNHMALYSPAPYLPQLLGIAVARQAKLNLLQGLYVTRFFNWFFSLLVLGFALWIVRESKRAWWTIFLCLTTPMALAVFSSPSSDALLIALSGLASAMVLAGQAPFGVILGLAAFFSASKLIFFLIPFVFLPQIWVAPGRWRKLALFSLAAILPNLIWTLLTRDLYSPFRPGVSAPEQLSWTLSHPMDALIAIFSTISDKWKYWISSGVGILGWLDVPVRNAFPWGIIILLYTIFGWGSDSIPFSKRRVWLLVALAFSFLVILTQYLSFTPIGVSWVEGVSGRYFLPVLPLVILAVPSLGSLPLRGEYPARWVMALGFVWMQGVALKALWMRYWGA